MARICAIRRRRLVPGRRPRRRHRRRHQRDLLADVQLRNHGGNHHLHRSRTEAIRNGTRCSMIPIVEEADLRAAVSPERAVAAMRDAFEADGLGRTRVPAVINLEVPGAHGEFHVKTAYIEGVPHVAVKVASGFYDNPSRGLPSGSGLMALFDATTGLPTALLLDNGFLTDIRTAAAGALAADLLAARVIG